MRITVIKENFSVIKDFTILGFMGENNARVIEVNQPEVEGADTYRLRFEYQDGVIYDVPIENGMVTVTGSLLREVGKVNCQWIATKAVDDSYELVAKSQVFGLCVEPSIDDSATPIPSPEIATDALARMQETVAQAENCVADAQIAVAQAETIAQDVEEAVNEVKSTTDRVADNTEILNRIYVDSDLSYEIVEGRNVTFSGSSYIDGDDSCFTVYVKIPDKPFGCIYCTGRNATTVYYGKTYNTPTFICDKDKNILGTAGNTNVLTVFGSKSLSNYEAPAYFAVTYSIDTTKFEINLHSADAINEPFIPVAETELGEDFLIKGKNLISDFVNVIWDYTRSYWKYYQYTHSNFFEVENGKTYYHNSTYIYLLYFDENYSYISNSGLIPNGTTLEIAENVKYAVAYKTGENLPEDFWFSETDLRGNKYTPARIIKPEYVDLTDIDKKQINSWYNGKRASFMGDSITANGTGGVYITDLDDYFGFSNWTKTAIGGTYVSGEGNSFGAAFWQDDRVNAVDLDSDIIFIMGGTNDANNNVSLGDNDISNCDTDTFYGAYNVLISKLIYKFYKLETGYYADIDYSGVTQVETAKPVKIFLITPPYMLSSERQYEKTPSFAEAVVEIGKRLGCPVCDTRANSDINLFLADYYAGYRNNNPEPDYVHLSEEAHHHWASVIIGKMLEVEPIW